MIGGSRFLTLCTPTTPADMMMLATSVLFLSLLKNNEFVANTDIVTLVPFAFCSKLLGRDSEPVDLSLLIIMLNISSSILWSLKLAMTALMLSPVKVMGFTLWTETAKVD